MSLFITDIGVSTNQAEEQKLQKQGFSKFPVSLSQGKGNAVHMWNKKTKDEPPITRVQFTYNEEMSEGLEKAGYTKDDYPFITPDGPVFIWTFRGNTQYDVPMVEISITSTPESEAEMLKQGFEKVSCNVSYERGGAGYVWAKRAKPTFICDVTATNSYDKDAELFEAGFIRIDEPTNTVFEGHKSTNFLWYRLTTDPSDAVTDLQISTDPDQYKQCLLQLYELIDVNLNQGTGGRTVYLWSYPDPNLIMTMDPAPGIPVKTMMLLHYQYPIQAFENAGVHVINKNINDGNTGLARFLCFLK